MDLNVGNELAALRRIPVRDLQLRYAEVFGETTNTRHNDWMVKRILWRVQALGESDLTERACQRAERGYLRIVAWVSSHALLVTVYFREDDG
jgi:hypothetical protein